MFTILHIDKSKLFQKILGKICKKLNIRYLSCFDSTEIDNFLNNYKIDIIFKSLETDNIDKAKLFDGLERYKKSNIPIIVITSYESVEMRKKMYDLGVVDVLPKSISPEMLIEYFKNILKKDEMLERIKNCKIAVIDDSDFELNLIRKIFEFNGIHYADYFKDPVEFLKSKKEYNLYLVDVIMPNMSGEQVVIELRKRNNKSVIIAISAVDNYKTITNILLFGANDYIIKPFNTSVFMARIRTNMRTFYLMKQNEEQNNELVLKNEILNQMVISDSLTGVYNHKYIYESLERELEKAKVNGDSLSMVMFDIDHFKTINDNYGHQTGDNVLLEVAHTIKSEIRDEDILGRYGGEEFGLILPGKGLEIGYKIAERIRQKNEEKVFENEEVKITISAGCVEFTDERALDLVSKADILLYKAKNNGRNRVEIAEKDILVSKFV